MSSPAASASGGDSKNPVDQITFRFCSECSNMLYPKEDEAERKLMFTCRTCNFSEEATSSCIFRNTMSNSAGETAGVTQDVASDPTVGSPCFSFTHVDSDRQVSNSLPSPPPLCVGSPDSVTSSLASTVASASITSSTCTVSSCLSCGRIISCNVCHRLLEAPPSPRPLPYDPDLIADDASVASCEVDPDFDDLGDVDIDLDDAEIFAWTGDSLDELGTILQPEGLFGMEEVVQAEMELKPTLSPVLVPRVLSQQIVSAATHG
ncbi:hypothetical protein VTJ49DRAFT_1540 [Mycothermus thermophilus]|uniref:DNA-directed RNA polymerase II subunit RPB9-like zinc ribbon domain-containing protein n=1 Tax=Humicola insolens TaxID=85995 RepID=A0ABR3VC33_HUMIN